MITATSRLAFSETKSDREVQCQRLLSVYRAYGPMSDRQVSYLLGWERGNVSARRNDLKGKVFELGHKKDPDTNKTVNVYGLIRETLFD